MALKDKAKEEGSMDPEGSLVLISLAALQVR